MEEMIQLPTGELGGAAMQNDHRARTCKAATLSAWVAFLTCSIVIFHAVMSLLDSLLLNEKFWQQTDQIVKTFADSKSLCQLSSASEDQSISSESITA